MKRTRRRDAERTLVAPSHRREESGRRTLAEGTGVRWAGGRPAFWLVVVLGLTAIAYLPSLSAGFTNWDDDVYVSSNPAVLQPSVPTLLGFFSSYHNGNYHPLTMLSLALDSRIMGADPRIFHAVNLLLHLANTALVLWLVLTLFAALEVAVPAALLFGVHPLHVESVAWISERKDVLYTMFFLAALILYARGRGPVHGPRSSPLPGGTLVISLGLFVLSLLSKGQAVTLAPTLLLVDHLQGRKLLEKRGLLEKAPFFLLSLVFGLVAVRAQSSAAAIFDHAARSSFDRVLFASYGLVMYVVKLVGPFGLSAVYPYPSTTAGSLPLVFPASLVAALALLAAAAVFLKRSRPAFFGLSFFILNILPVLQLLPVGNAIMADRYSYVPSVGIFALAGLGWQPLIPVLRPRPPLALGVRVLGVGYVLTLAAMTVSRCAVWTDSLSLWTDTVAKAPTSEIAWSSLGSVHDDLGRDAEALEDYTRAIAINPGFAKAYASRARCRTRLGDPDGARQDAERALQLRPDLAYVHTTRGIVALGASDAATAEASFGRAMEIDPGDAEAYAGRGAVKRKGGDLRGALGDLEIAVRLDPDSEENHSNRGILKAEAGDTAGAVSDFGIAIRLNPAKPGPYVNRAIVRLEANDRAAACADLRDAERRGARLPASMLARACGP